MHKELEDFYAVKDNQADYLSTRIENAPSDKIRNYLNSLKPLMLNMTDFRITVHQLEYPARNKVFYFRVFTTVIIDRVAKHKHEHKSLIDRQTFSKKEQGLDYQRGTLAKIRVIFMQKSRILTFCSSTIEELSLQRSVSHVFLQW